MTTGEDPILEELTDALVRFAEASHGNAKHRVRFKSFDSHASEPVKAERMSELRDRSETRSRVAKALSRLRENCRREYGESGRHLIMVMDKGPMASTRRLAIDYDVEEVWGIYRHDFPKWRERINKRGAQKNA